MKDIEGTKLDRLQQLKMQALALIKQQAQDDPLAPAMSIETQQLLESLRIYQVELELQNEELLRAQREAELSNTRYQSLFEQMSLPAIVVDAMGMIQRCNERGETLLGANRSFARQDNRLLQRLSREDRSRLHASLKEVTPGLPLIVEKLEFSSDEVPPPVFDAHLIQLSLSYHLDGHAMILLVDRSAEVAREQDHHFFSLLLDSSDAFIYAADKQGKMLMANQALLNSLGLRREDVLGQARENFLPLREAMLHRSADERVLASGEPLTLEERVYTGSALGMREVLTRKFPLRDLQGLTYGVAGISSDMTEIKTQQRQALLSESLFMAASEAIIVTDKKGKIIRVNPAFTKISGFSETSVVGYPPSILKSGRQDAAFYTQMWNALTTQGTWAGEMSNRAADGHMFMVWSSINAIVDERDNVTHYIAVQTDLTQLHEAQGQIRQLASYDSLTGLPNRALFNDRISQLVSHAQRHLQTFALLFVDLDRFKEVNDSLGHQIGDELLIAIARRLQEVVRTEDTVARMGGDEFVVLLPGANSQIAQQVADKLIQTLRAPMPLGGLIAYQPMASAGIALFPDDGESADLLLRNADLAMYAAKLAGRNRSTAYHRDMSQASDHIFAIQADLAAGIDRQELRLYFQPKFRLDTGALVGAEALVRWQRPGFGLVMPGEFIAIAEKSGLVVAIDQWVLNEALRQVGEWKKDGLWHASWRIAVNQSASDLRRPTLMSELQAMLQAHQMSASALELEITEGALLEHTEEMIRRLLELKVLGVSLAIDDFGTGYSSLSYLRKLPISVVKIDQGFIRDMLINDSDRILVETIIAMAHNLGHELVAEGIEETAQRQRLADLGCEVGQGYLFGRPMDAEQFAQTYLANTAARITA
jgi:diguanylate cyclase (GGDEF)-like protein/PAS domain S-box-containing protein